MFRFWAALMLAVQVPAAGTLYELAGRLMPDDRALVSIFGATSPFQAQTLSDDNGRFRFRNLRAGTYTVAVYMPRRGEARQTVEVGPGTADPQGRVSLTLKFKDSDFAFNDLARRLHTVTAKALAIPEAAFREYLSAGKDLQKHHVDSAVRRLEHAVELAPQFAQAWNNLGTIAYQSRQYPRAEKCFRTALEADPKAYEPLVNLGGVLIDTHRLGEAMRYNQAAVAIRPNDALANAQLGLTCFATGDYDQAVKYLEIARSIDPAHFSRPQLVLAEIHLRRGEKKEAAGDLEDFLQHHPDSPDAARIRKNIARLRN